MEKVLVLLLLAGAWVLVSTLVFVLYKKDKLYPRVAPEEAIAFSIGIGASVVIPALFVTILGIFIR